jgi:hypothetical protein
MPDTNFATRDQWKRVRDAVPGLKSGYIKQSIGDLLDKANKAMPKTGQGDSKGAGEAAVELYAACAAYIEKLEKEDKLAGVRPDATLPDNGQPAIGAVVVLLNQTKNKAGGAIVKLHKEDALAKVMPKAREELAEEVRRRNLAMITRTGWVKHRDDAGLPAHYVDASIGDLLDAWQDAVKTLNQKQKVTEAATNLLIAAVKYYDKLVKEGKIGKPKVKNVHVDLKQMADKALYMINDYGNPEPLLAALKAQNLKWTPLLKSEPQ